MAQLHASHGIHGHDEDHGGRNGPNHYDDLIHGVPNHYHAHRGGHFHASQYVCARHALFGEDRHTQYRDARRRDEFTPQYCGTTHRTRAQYPS